MSDSQFCCGPQCFHQNETFTLIPFRCKYKTITINHINQIQLNSLTPPPTPDNQQSQLTAKSNQKTNWPVQQKADWPTTYLPVPGRDSRGNSVSTTLRWSVLWQFRNTLWTRTTSRWSVLRQLMNTMDLFVVMLVDLLSWTMLGQWLGLCEYFRVIYVSLFIRYLCLFSGSKPTVTNVALLPK